MNTQFTFSQDRNTLLKNGVPFFVSPTQGTTADMNVGCVIPKISLPWSAASGAAPGKVVIVGTGSCCSGFIMVICDEDSNPQIGKIEMIQGIDFNVHHLNPVVFRSKHLETTCECLGFLVTGTGCAGKGVRFVHFDVLPIVTPIVSTAEADSVLSEKLWFTTNPLVRVKDIWQRFEKHGIDIDRHRTAEVQKEFSLFRAAR